MKQNFLQMLSLAAGLLVAGCNTADNGDMDQSYGAQFLEKTYEGTMTGIQGSGDRFDEFTDNPFVATAVTPTSTFSVDADGASYAIMRCYLKQGYEVNPQSVRIEEYLNYFTFNYLAPTNDETIAINAEVGQCPWNTDHLLLRLGLKGKELQEGEVPLANYVFLVDVSGSMYGSDRLDLLKAGLNELLLHMNPDDRISIVTYSGTVKKLLESTPVREAGKISQTISQLMANGSTAGGEALKMAYEEALANFDPTCNNRIIMGTDGDFNVGVTNTQELVAMVQEYASRGIYMTCLGFGMGNLNDQMMEKISNSGNGNYHYIDSEDEMMKVFVHERERFVCVANDTKCQVTFDSTLVSQYRLIGYENRVMSNSDFTDDTKDAGDIGAGQTVTALYELVPSNLASRQSNQTVATFDVRYKKSLGADSRPLSRAITIADIVNKNERSADFYFAAGVAAYGMVLRNSPYKGDATYIKAQQLVQQGLTYDPHGYRQELLQLIDSYIK